MSKLRNTLALSILAAKLLSSTLLFGTGFLTRIRYVHVCTYVYMYVYFEQGLALTCPSLAIRIIMHDNYETMIVHNYVHVLVSAMHVPSLVNACSTVFYLLLFSFSVQVSLCTVIRTCACMHVLLSFMQLWVC